MSEEQANLKIRYYWGKKLAEKNLHTVVYVDFSLTVLYFELFFIF